MRQAAWFAVLGAALVVLAGCGRGGDKKAEEEELEASGYKILFDELEDHDSGSRGRARAGAARSPWARSAGRATRSTCTSATALPSRS